PRFGSEIPPTARAVLPRVSEPSSPKAAASGAPPQPTPSRTTMATLRRRTSARAATARRTLVPEQRALAHLPSHSRVHAPHATADADQQLVHDRTGESGEIAGPDLLVARAAEQHHFVTDVRFWNPAQIEHGGIHRDAAENRNATAAQQRVPATRE